MPRQLRVFLCHASQDKPAVRELYRRLKTEDWIDPWLDEEKLSFGQHWTTTIEDALSDADVVLIFLSKNSVQKEGFVQRELNYAWELSLEKPRNVIFLIPFRLDNCQIPRYLGSRQWGDYFGEKKDSTYQILLRSLKQRYQQKLKLEAEEERGFQATEKLAQKKAKKDAADKAAREKAVHEKIEREILEKAALEKAKQENKERKTYFEYYQNLAQDSLQKHDLEGVVQNLEAALRYSPNQRGKSIKKNIEKYRFIWLEVQGWQKKVRSLLDQGADLEANSNLDDAKKCYEDAFAIQPSPEVEEFIQKIHPALRMELIDSVDRVDKLIELRKRIDKFDDENVVPDIRLNTYNRYLELSIAVVPMYKEQIEKLEDILAERRSLLNEFEVIRTKLEGDSIEQLNQAFKRIAEIEKIVIKNNDEYLKIEFKKLTDEAQTAQNAFSEYEYQGLIDEAEWLIKKSYYPTAWLVLQRAEALRKTPQVDELKNQVARFIEKQKFVSDQFKLVEKRIEEEDWKGANELLIQIAGIGEIESRQKEHLENLQMRVGEGIEKVKNNSLIVNKQENVRDFNPKSNIRTLSIGGIVFVCLFIFIFGGNYLLKALIPNQTIDPDISVSLAITSTQVVLSTDIAAKATYVEYTSVYETAVSSTMTAISLPTSTPNPGIGSTKDGVDDMTLVFVPAGEFTMGSDTGASDEQPAHTVNLDAFWIDQTEVTNAMYAQCVEAGDCSPPASVNSFTRYNYYGNSEFDDYPVIHVDWKQANAYCSWAGRRLPTEAEWEKAASWNDLDKEKYVYPWGNEFSCKNGNFDDETQRDSYVIPGGANCDGFSDTAPVGSFPSGVTSYGTLDMSGNVLEWVSSLYQDYPYTGNDGREDLSASGSRVLRGGSWYSIDSYIRSANRGGDAPTLANYFIGFRCALSQQ